MKNTLKNLAPTVVRLGIAMVFIWFGLNQLFNQAMWVSLIPSWAISLSGLSAKSFVIVNGLVEIILASLLAFGMKIRIVATLLALHLLTIVMDLGLDAIGVRDIGLMFATISIALYGPDIFSWDMVSKKDIQAQPNIEINKSRYV